jgi:hypothetical protein
MAAAFVLGDLAEIVLALLVVLCALAVAWIFNGVASLLPVIKIDLAIATFKIDLGQPVRSAGNGIEQWAVDEGKKYFDDLARLWNATAYIGREIFDSTISVATHLGGQIAHLYNDVIPAGVSAAEDFTVGRIELAKNTIEGDISAAATAAGTALAAADRAIYKTIADTESTIENDLRSAVASAVNTAEAFASTAVADSASLIDAHLGALYNELTGDVSSLEQQIGSAVAAVASTAAAHIAAVESELTGEIAQVGSTAADDVAALGRTLGGDIAAVPGLIAGDLTGLEAVLGAAITTAVAAVAVRVATLERCAVTTCSGPNEISGLLNTLLGVGEFAAVFAFLAQIIRDPAGAEADYAGVIGGLFGTGQTLVDSLLSL